MAFYNPPRPQKYNYQPDSREPYKLSRSGIDLYVECPRCFYLDRRLGIGRPPGFPFSLNAAVDLLLKKEFDVHRIDNTAHPLMAAYGIKAVPFQHKDLEVWRENFKGITFLHKSSGFLVSGAIDDVWINSDKELIIVDYKATAKDGEVNLDAEWQEGYKRQMEVYQWLFGQNGFKVSPTGYFVYCNGRRDRKAFDGKLEFNIKLLPHRGNTSWIEETLMEIKTCLNSEIIPEPSKNCDYCKYRKITIETEKKQRQVPIANQIDTEEEFINQEKKEDSKYVSGKLF